MDWICCTLKAQRGHTDRGIVNVVMGCAWMLQLACFICWVRYPIPWLTSVLNVPDYQLNVEWDVYMLIVIVEWMAFLGFYGLSWLKTYSWDIGAPSWRCFSHIKKVSADTQFLWISWSLSSFSILLMSLEKCGGYCSRIFCICLQNSLVGCNWCQTLSLPF